MRTAFINQLIKEARTDDKIFLMVGDLGFSVVEPFANEFPNRFLNAGIAEQNMIGMSAGLAKEGFKVFVYSIGNFPTLRAMEQIRYDVCYHNMNVKIIAVGGGYAYGPLGASHHATEEMGMLRTIPNLNVCVPGDPIETSLITSLICKHQGPAYLRLGKAGEPVVHSGNLNLMWGDMICVNEGKDIAVLSTGAMLYYCKTTIEHKGFNFGLYSVPFVKPLNYNHLSRIAKRYKCIITIEEHQKSSGFGSAILEGLNDLMESGEIKEMPLVKRIGIPDEFCNTSGSQTYLRVKERLIIENIQK